MNFLDVGVGVVIGILLQPFLSLVITAVCSMPSCCGDCRQGRDPCNCREEVK